MESQIKELWFEIDSKNHQVKELDLVLSGQKNKIIELEQEARRKTAVSNQFELDEEIDRNYIPVSTLEQELENQANHFKSREARSRHKRSN